MRRRDFLTLLGGATAAWPVAARAQQPAMPLIGVLISSTLGPYAERLAAFHRGLKQGGFVEGANLAVEYRSRNIARRGDVSGRRRTLASAGSSHSAHPSIAEMSLDQVGHAQLASHCART